MKLVRLPLNIQDTILAAAVATLADAHDTNDFIRRASQIITADYPDPFEEKKKADLREIGKPNE